MKNILKTFIRKNPLTPDPNDYTAVVSHTGKIDKEGLIDVIVEEGIELKRETIDDVVTRYNRTAARFAVQGWNVDTGLVYLRAVITGIFYGKKFDHDKNSVYVAATQGVVIRKELANTEIEILGELPDVMAIYQVTNIKTRAADGTLTRGRNAEIEGSYIKIAGDDQTVGVWLENLEGAGSFKLDDDLIVINAPSKLTILIPTEIPEGLYQLKIITQYTSAKLLKAPREAVFAQELTVN
jgi:hypothetical protein